MQGRFIIQAQAVERKGCEGSFLFEQAASVLPVGINYRLPMFPNYSQIYLNSEMKNPLKHGELIKSPKNSPALLNTHLCQTNIHAFDASI